MDEDNEREDEEVPEDWEDKTKDEFFSDLLEMEDQIDEEAYELVEHAMSLIEHQYYDDAVEVLRQAMGLYEQISMSDEIEAIRNKISEVYMLKETVFKEKEVQQEGAVDETGYDAEVLIEEANQLIEIDEYDEAIERYDEALRLVTELNNNSEVERINRLIEDCYDLKATFLQKGKVEALVETITDEEEVISEESIEELKIKEYEAEKQYEEEVSNYALELMGEASELTEQKQYDEAIQLYEESMTFFKEINWVNEIKKVEVTIKQLEKQREKFQAEQEKQRELKERRIEVKEAKAAFMAEKARRLERRKEMEKQQKLREAEAKKMEEKAFETLISNTVNQAEKMAREYEIAIKKGQFDKESPFESIVQMYEHIRNLLLQRGWRDQSIIYLKQIKIYKEKWNKDIRLREIEEKKKQKELEYQEMLSSKKEEAGEELDAEMLKTLEEQYQKEAEVEEFRNKIEEMARTAEKMAREYEVAIRKGKFEVECVYPEIIDTYEEIKQMCLERELDDDAAIYSTHIKKYEAKLTKDNKLREIEEQKKAKDKEYEAIYTAKADAKPTIKMDVIQAQLDKEAEEEEFQAQIDKMTNEAEKTSREYEVSIRKGKWETECPYPKIIETLENIKQMVSDKGWKGQVAIYTTLIRKYQEKLAKDNKLREIEEQKKLKDKEYEELYKTKREVKADVIEASEAQLEREAEEEALQNQIDQLVNEAEKITREYETAIRRGKWEIECPYSKIIDDFENLKETVSKKGLKDQVPILSSQIRTYNEKLAKDNKLREIEEQKKLKDKEYEELYKTKSEVKSDMSEAIQAQLEKEAEDEAFQIEIDKKVRDAEKAAREYEVAIRRGKFEEECPYPKIIETFEEIKKQIIERGWDDQVVIYTSQIRNYNEKLAKDNKLREIEEQKKAKDKEYEELYKTRRDLKDEKLGALQKQKAEEKEFENKINQMVNEAEKMAREYETAIRRGNWEIECPYPKIIETYKELKKMLIEKDWKQQANIYISQIKNYQQKLEKDKKLREIEAQKAEKQKQYEEIYKAKEADTMKAEVLETHEQKGQEEYLTEQAFGLIDEAEKIVKEYEIKARKNILKYESPYDDVISKYNQARKLFQKAGWREESSRLINTIKLYKEKQERDNKLREYERKRLEEPEVEIKKIEVVPEKEDPEKLAKIKELEEKKKREEQVSNEAFAIIDEAEAMAKEYDAKLKEGEFTESPYDKIIEIYREAKGKFEEIGWKDEGARLINTINFYKDKKEKDEKLRALEAEKAKKRQEELEEQQRIIEKARAKELAEAKQREQEFMAKKEEASKYETLKDNAFNLMDQAKREYNQNNYEEAINLYQESEKLFKEIDWPKGVTMVRDSITMIKKKQAEIERRSKMLEAKLAERKELEAKLEEKLSKIKDLQQVEQESKRKELAKIQEEKQQEKEISEKAYTLLEEGTNLLNKKKFDEANEKYVAARDLFKKIGWAREVSRINNDLLLKLRKERKRTEDLLRLQQKTLEEKAARDKMFEESQIAKKESARKKKEEERKRLIKLEGETKLSKQIMDKMDKANNLIEDHKYNEGIITLQEVIKLMEKSGSEDDINNLRKQIDKISQDSAIPLLVLEALDKDEDMDKFTAVYMALDSAEMSISNDQYMKAISQLNEAKHNLKELKIGKNFIEIVDSKINECRDLIKKKRVKKPKAKEPTKIEVKEEKELTSEVAYEYMDKCKREERRNNFDKAIELATTAKDIFEKLGDEWSREKAAINQYIITLQQKQEARQRILKRVADDHAKKDEELKKEEDEFKERITARRAERRKKIQELMKEKQQK